MWPFTRKDKASAKTANILDPIHDTLDPRMWDNPASPEPTLKPEHSKFIHRKIYSTLEEHGYDGVERWLKLVLTGSLTTYQYSDESDCDVSLFIDSTNLPEWSRAEMIGIMVQYCDGTVVPGTPFPLQDFVVSRKLSPEDLYKPGLRSGYDLASNQWIVPPDKSRVHDVEHEYNLAYTQALEAADKMDRLLKFEPLQAARYWHTIHKKRQRDMQHGLGDFSNSNIVYKMLANRGMFDRISELTGEHIASVQGIEEQIAEMVGARWDEMSLVWPNGERVHLDLIENNGTIELFNIRAEPEGGGLGSEVIKAMQKLGIPIRADQVLAPDFFEKHDFQQDPNADEGRPPDFLWNPHEAAEEPRPPYGSLEELAEAHPQVDTHATESPITGAINLHALKVAPELQNQGLAGAYMRDLVNYADQNQKTIALNAEAYGGEPGLATNRLKKWYQSFGFFPNKGRRKDYMFKENHIRYPQG